MDSTSVDSKREPRRSEAGVPALRFLLRDNSATPTPRSAPSRAGCRLAAQLTSHRSTVACESGRETIAPSGPRQPEVAGVPSEAPRLRGLDQPEQRRILARKRRPRADVRAVVERRKLVALSWPREHASARRRHLSRACATPRGALRCPELGPGWGRSSDASSSATSLAFASRCPRQASRIRVPRSPLPRHFPPARAAAAAAP